MTVVKLCHCNKETLKYADDSIKDNYDIVVEVVTPDLIYFDMRLKGHVRIMISRMKR